MSMQRHMWVVKDLDEYRKIFDHAWSERLLMRTEGTPVEEAAFTLATYWRGAANTHVLPWLMARSLQLMHDSATDAATGVDIWELLVSGETEVEFAWCLWGSQRLVYGALYHAYEDFIRHCVGIIDGTNYFRGDDLFGAVRTAFGRNGKAVVSACLEDELVTIARLARNAIAHNGGKVTEKLLRKNHHFKIVANEIQITPDDNRELFNTLKGNVDTLTDHALAKLAEKKGAP